MSPKTRPVVSERTSQAARNKAQWCDAVCRAHGRPGEFAGGIWINRHDTPRYYPNAVTFSEASGAAEQSEKIAALAAERVPKECTVKDSFCALDLAPLGFEILFEAQWIYRPASLPAPEVRIEGVRWCRVETASELAAWEAAWSGVSAEKTGAEQARIFMPSLLHDQSIAVLAAYQAGQIVAGAIANWAADVVGWSNLFVPRRNGKSFAAGGLAALIDTFLSLPIVGYESGRELIAAQASGFEALGPLRVWALRSVLSAPAM